jgi:hypothetical protein
MSALPRDLAAQPAVAADRFAHEIGGILAVSAVRSRRLNGNPFGPRGGVIIILFSFWMWRIGRPEGALCLIRRAFARCAGVV